MVSCGDSLMDFLVDMYWLGCTTVSEEIQKEPLAVLPIVVMIVMLAVIAEACPAALALPAT